jgi:hypothetical protein
MRPVSIFSHVVTFIFGLLISYFSYFSYNQPAVNQDAVTAQLEAFREKIVSIEKILTSSNDFSNTRAMSDSKTTNESWPFSMDFLRVPVHQPPAAILQLQHTLKIALFMGNIPIIIKAKILTIITKNKFNKKTNKKV